MYHISAWLRRFGVVLSVGFLVVIASGCDPDVSYQTPGPISIIFSVDAQGNITIQGSISLETYMGNFSLNSDQEPLQPSSPTAILLVIRQTAHRKMVDDIYQVQANGEKATVTTQGSTTIEYFNGKIIVDASKGELQQVNLQLTPPTPVLSTEEQPVLDYCNALQSGQKEVYAQFFDRDTGGSLAIKNGNQTISSANTFSALASKIDQRQGKATTCAIKSDISTSNFPCSGVSDPGENTLDCTYTYTITVQVVRSSGPSYSVSADVTVEVSCCDVSTTITAISTL
jgi:hypothetical protein